MSQTKTSLGHQRLDARYITLQERVCQKLSVVIRLISNDRAEEVGFGRLLRHSELCLKDLIKMGVEFSLQNIESRHVLLLQDTSELSFGVAPFQDGLLEVGSGKEYGFFVHPVIALDAQSSICLGLANVEVFKRQTSEIHRGREKYENKQTYRWLSSVQKAKSNCEPCQSTTVISDREGDIYDALCGYKTAGMGFVIRSRHDRPLSADHGGIKLPDQIAQWEVKGEYSCVLPRTDKRSPHEALLEVKFGQVAFRRPEKAVSRSLDATFLTHIVEVKENPSTVVNNEQPIHWRLITSHPVETMEQAKEVINWYTKRWHIEQVFRVLKKQGLDITASLSHKFESLSRLAVIGLVAAVRVLQLTTARDHVDDTPASIAFEESEIKVIESLSPTLEGKTDVQKNPNPKSSLAFAAWVVARLGGWKGYSKSERPLGPITFLRGLQRLQNYMDIYSVLNGP